DQLSIIVDIQASKIDRQTGPMRQPAIKRLKHTEQDKRQPFALERLPRNCWIRAERSSGSQGTEALRGTRLGARKRTAGKSTLRWRRRGIANLSNGFK